METGTPKRKTTTSNTVKQKFNTKTYKDYRVPIRRDSALFDKVEKLPRGEFSPLVKVLLEEHFKDKN